MTILKFPDIHPSPPKKEIVIKWTGNRLVPTLVMYLGALLALPGAIIMVGAAFLQSGLDRLFGVSDS